MPTIAVERVIGSLVWLGLVHGLWLGLAAPALAALVLKGCPNLPRSSRHAFLFGAFLLATIGPFLVAAAHREAARQSCKHENTKAVVSIRRMTAAAAEPVQSGLSYPSRAVQIHGHIKAQVDRMARTARPWVLTFWGFGLAGMIGLLICAYGASRRLLRQCQPAPEAVERMARRLGRKLGLRRSPPVRVHDAIGEPCLCGLVRPSVVLPAGWLKDARPRHVAAVLAHELAHAWRRDPLVHLTQCLLEALVLFHPGACWLSRALRLQREHRADALAVRLTSDARALAEALESFARIRLASRRRAPLGIALGGESSTLFLRIQEILDMRSEPERSGFWPVVTLSTAGLLALIVSTSGLAWAEEPAVPAAGAAGRESPEPLAVDAEKDRAQISYEVGLLEAADLAGFDFDFEFGDNGKPIRVSFASEIERRLLIGSVTRSPSGRLVRAPKVTAFERQDATIGFIEEVPQFSVNLSGAFKAKDDIRLVIRLSEENAEAARHERNMTCTVPSGGTLVLSLKGPDEAAAGGRERVILVTPRRILTEEEEEMIGRP